MKIKNSLLLSTFVAIAASGCGGGSSGGLTTKEFCAQKAEHECQVVPLCVTAVMATCLDQRKTACDEFVAKHNVAPRVFRPGNAARCLDKTKELYGKKSPITAGELAMMDNLCADVFRGDIKEDAACMSKFECEGTLICDKALCAISSVKKKDEQCANAGEVCEAGYLCTMVATVQRCAAKKMLGQSCDDVVPCVESLRCDGTCKERLGLGEACNNSDDCAPDVSYCDPYAGNVCDPGLNFATGATTCRDYGGAGGARPDSGAGGSGGGAADAAPETGADTTANETAAD